MRHTSAVIAVTLSLAGRVAPAAQEATTPPVRTEVVRLEVIVTDAQGLPVTNLAREEFEVLEDGKPQAVANFEAPSVALRASDVGEPVGAGAAVAGDSPGQPGPRRVAIVVDDVHVSRASVDTVRRTLLAFVDEMLAPEDEVALVVVGSRAAGVPLTRDREALRQAIGRITARADMLVAGSAEMTAAQAELILSGDRSSRELATGLNMDDPGRGISTFGGLSPRDAVGSGTSARDMTPAERLGAMEEGAGAEVEELARAVLSEALSISALSLSAVEAALRGMATLGGQKLCLLVSEGFLTGRGTREEQLRPVQQVIDAATRSGLAVYALMPRGLTALAADASTSGRTGPAGLRERVALRGERQLTGTLRDLSEDTGGFTVEGADLTGGLGRILKERESVYLLAYEPRNLKRDGRFRKIRVRLRRSGDFTIRSRKGYFAPDDRKEAKQRRRKRQGAAAAGPLSLAQAQLALDAPPPQGGLPVRLSAGFVAIPPTGAQAIVRAHVGTDTLRWSKSKDRQHAEFDLVGGVYDANGVPVGTPFGRRFTLDYPPGEAERAKAAGEAFQQAVPLGPGRYEVRILALDGAREPLGGARQPLEIPDLAEGKLALSGVFLQAASADGGVVRDAQALRRFRRDETLYFQLYVYNATRDEQGRADTVLQAQVRAGDATLGASPPQPALLQEKDGVPQAEANGLGLSGLAPGRYELRIVVVDRKANQTLFQDVDFTVE